MSVFYFKLLLPKPKNRSIKNKLKNWVRTLNENEVYLKEREIYIFKKKCNELIFFIFFKFSVDELM